jgi:hypothetical protein
MKSIRLLVLLIVPVLARAQAWPRDPQTGKIELRGRLPWPATVKTEAQRRELIRRWYFAKLTEESPAESRQATERAAYYHGKLTFDRLPQVVYHAYQSRPDKRITLLSEAQLTPTADGLVYRLTNFEVGYFEEDTGGGFLLEATPKLSAEDQRTFTLLRKRFTQALSGW